MKRTTIFMPEALAADLQRYARQAKKPAAWVVREALATFLSRHASPASLPASIGLGRSGRTDLAERFGELLFDDLSLTGNETSARRTKSQARHRPPRRRQ
jgi:hypothetical protein